MRKTIALFVDGLSVPAKEGLTTHYLELAYNLSTSKKWRPLMITADRARASRSELEALPYDTILLPAAEYYEREKVEALLKKYGVDIAQNHNPHYFSRVLAPAARGLGIATLYEMHDFEIDLAFMNMSEEETRVNVEAQIDSIHAATHTRILSKYDHDQILKEFPDLPKERISWLPFAVKKIESGMAGSAKDVLFIGNSSYPPNAQACSYIANKLARLLPDYKFHLVGRDTKKFMGPSNVVAHGEVDDMKKISLLRHASVGIAPISLGSGTKIKLLTYLSSGLPCVASSKAMSGFPLSKDAIAVADTDEDFADSIVHMSNSKNARIAAAEYFDKYFDMENTFAAVEEMYVAISLTKYSWQAPRAKEFDPSLLHWLKEAANDCFGKAVEVETPVLGDLDREHKSVIVVEGLPGAGKTTLVEELRSHVSPAAFVEEMPFPIDLQNEESFFENDIKKFDLSRALGAELIVMDRNYCSTLAFAYARTQMFGEGEVFSSAQRWVNEALASGKLCHPELYVYLDISPQESVTRRKSDSNDWGDVEFAGYVKEWYDAYFASLKDIAVISYDTAMPLEDLLGTLKRDSAFKKLTRCLKVLE